MERMSNFKDFIGELKVNYVRTGTKTTKIKNSTDVRDFIFEYYKEIIDDHEEFKVIHLNNRNDVVNVDNNAYGTDTMSLVDIKSIARNSILIKTHSVILIHNHPSGNLDPSEEDVKVTKRIKDALSLFDIRVLDHLILSREGYYSFADNGIL